MFTREAFLAGPKPKVERIEIEGHGPVCIRPMNVGELERFQKWMAGGPPQSEIAAGFVTAGVCDEDGRLLLTGADLDSLKELDPRFLVKVQDAVIRVNRLDEASAEGDGKKG